MQKQEVFEKLKLRLEHLKESPLYEYRKQNNYQPVIGEGSLNAKVMFVGEAPGKKEAETGRPFVGAAGKVLRQMLAEVGLKDEDVFITSVLHDRPPCNRDPKKRELIVYTQAILWPLIELINPKIIATLGRFSMEYIFEQFGVANDIAQISKIHGKVYEIESGDGNIGNENPKGQIHDRKRGDFSSFRDDKRAFTALQYVMPLYHPAVVLYRRTMEETLKEDFESLGRLVSQAS